MSIHILIGLLNLHKSKIVHRDIKLENILWNDRGAVVGDLGEATFWEGVATADGASTPRYHSDACEEALRTYKKMGDEENWFRAGKANDMYATGLSLFELYTGVLPDKNTDIKKQLTDICGEDAATIIEKMCQAPSFDTKNPADLFAVQVTDAELDQLIRFLVLKTA